MSLFFNIDAPDTQPYKNNALYLNAYLLLQAESNSCAESSNRTREKSALVSNLWVFGSLGLTGT
jgi:hypothetical protein